MPHKATSTGQRRWGIGRMLDEGTTRRLYAASARLLFEAPARDPDAGLVDPIDETFGSWKALKNDGAEYVRKLRSEWRKRERRLWGDD